MITGDFVNGLHLMVGKNSDMDNGSPKVTETSENTFFLNWESGKIYAFSGGSWAEVNSAVAGIVAALLNKGALPAVTSADNGKVLGVDDGVWTPVEGGLSDDAKQRLLACFAHVAWTDEHGQDYYDALEDALCPPADLVSITAVYLQDRPIYDTDDLDAIKAGDDLTVTANYSDGTSVVLGDDDYTLSGTLTAGTSVITVSYGGKSTTISVTVTHEAGYVTSGLIHRWDGINNTGSGHSGSATTWKDLVGSSDLTITGQYASWVSNALSFVDSLKDYVYTDTLDNQSACTLEVCFESTGSTNTNIVMINPESGTDLRNARQVVIYTDNTVGGYATSGLTYSNTEAAISDIRTVSVNYTDLAVNSMYINAAAASLSNKTHSYRYDGTHQMYVGGNDNNTKFTGKVYSVRIYNRALTAEEIAANYAVDLERFGLE